VEPLSYSTDGTQGIRVAFGVFVFLVALVPSSIVAAQWLSYSGQGAEPMTSAGSLIPGAAIMLYGLWVITHRERVVIDPRARTLTWIASGFGVTLKATEWSFDDVTDIELVRSSGVRNTGCFAQVKGPRGARMLLSYFRSTTLPPHALKETSRMIGKPLEKR